MDIISRLTSLRESRTPCVLATVVASYPPQSVRAGAKAIIFSDGTIDGWIGGGCIRPIVLDEAREAVAAATPRLVRMNAGGRAVRANGVHDYPMTCQGEGGVEIYLEPMLPAPRLVVLGDTPVAHALVRLANEVGYELGADAVGADAVVVATMGVGDEEALDRATQGNATYVGLVASRKKASFLFDYLRATGVPDERLATVKAPAGLDLGGMSPGEIAVSILAEIIQRKHHGLPASHPDERTHNSHPDERTHTSHPDERTHTSHPDERSEEGSALRVAEKSRSLATLGMTSALDPICGMSVDKATAKHTLAIGGETFYFCCPHCKVRFAKAHA